MNSIAVMQPYFFPYIGYFQLIHAVDKFIFYDDVNFIKNGWINRNRILINNKASYLTIPCKKASSNLMIKDIEHGLTERDKNKILKKIRFTYSNAPYFSNVISIIEDVLNTDTDLISELAINSILKTSEYLVLKPSFQRSSVLYSNKELDAANRLIDICNQEGMQNYINPLGGKKLYDKDYFKNNGIDLYFLESRLNTYPQFNNDFIQGLSIIDIMMFNSIEKIKSELLENYKLI